MTTAASASQPRRAEVAAAYDLGADVYAALWSPVILPAAQAVVAALAPSPAARVLDVGGLLAGASLRPTRIWLERLRHHWEPSAYYRFVTGSGRNRQRLQQLDAGQRGEVLDQALKRLRTLDPDAFAWSGEVVCAVATLPHQAG
jgi:hypothetical protein